MLILHLFVSYAHVNLCHFFSSTGCQGLASTSACGSSWTFLFTFFLDFHQPHVVAIQETKINSSIATSELFPETCPYSVYRKDRNIHGGGVMLLVHKDISHMPITELEKRLGINLGESVCKQNFSFCGKLVSTAW